VCPPVPHKQLGSICDFGTWLGRGWCRLEQCSLLLARYNNVPSIIVKGGGSPPVFGGSNIALRAVGEGNFTCCARGHQMKDAVTGEMVAIPCDRVTIAPLMLKMLKKRTEFLLGNGELDAFRAWQAHTPNFLSGLPHPGVPQGESLADFYRRFHCTNERDKDPSMALFLATCEGNLSVVRDALANGAALEVRLSTAVPELFQPKGVWSTLSASMLHFRAEAGEAVLAELLQRGADPNTVVGGGREWQPIASAVIGFKPEAIRALHRLTGAALRVNRTYYFHRLSTLLWAAYAGDTACQYFQMTACLRIYPFPLVRK